MEETIVTPVTVDEVNLSGVSPTGDRDLDQEVLNKLIDQRVRELERQYDETGTYGDEYRVRQLQRQFEQDQQASMSTLTPEMMEERKRQLELRKVQQDEYKTMLVSPFAAAGLRATHTAQFLLEHWGIIEKSDQLTKRKRAVAGGQMFDSLITLLTPFATGRPLRKSSDLVTPKDVRKPGEMKLNPADSFGKKASVTGPKLPKVVLPGPNDPLMDKATKEWNLFLIEYEWSRILQKHGF